MNNRQGKQLRRELAAAGAVATELKELANIASKLGGLKNSATLRRANMQQRKLRLALTISIPAVTSLILGAFLVIASQTVLPGSPLYPVQATSDTVASLLDPSYRGTVMMRRAEQVRQLIDNHAPSSRVLATLSDYQKQVNNYKSTTASYAAFEYCKDDLQQATVQATGNEREAINKTLSSLTNT